MTERTAKFTDLLRNCLAGNLAGKEITGKKVYDLLAITENLPNGMNPRARVAQSLKYLEDSGFIKKIHTGSKGNKNPHRYILSETSHAPEKAKPRSSAASNINLRSEGRPEVVGSAQPVTE